MVSLVDDKSLTESDKESEWNVEPDILEKVIDSRYMQIHIRYLCSKVFPLRRVPIKCVGVRVELVVLEVFAHCLLDRWYCRPLIWYRKVVRSRHHLRCREQERVQEVERGQVSEPYTTWHQRPKANQKSRIENGLSDC